MQVFLQASFWNSLKHRLQDFLCESSGNSVGLKTISSQTQAYKLETKGKTVLVEQFHSGNLSIEYRVIFLEEN